MRGIHIRLTVGPVRAKPKHGDRRTTKKHGEQIRVFRMSQGCYVVSSGRQLYDWVPISEADKHGAGYHWTAEEKAKYSKTGAQPK